MGKRIVQFCFVVLFAILCSSCFAQTIIRVKPDGNDANNGSTWALAKKTVQAGINAAASNGEVWVAAGTYKESIDLKASCNLYGGFAGVENQRSERNYCANVSMITSASVSATGSTVCIDGFTIRNTITNSGYGSRGVYCSTSTNLTIANNTITGCDNGIECYYPSKPTIVNNTIIGNVDGIHCHSSSNPTIINNTIVGNNGNGINSSSSPTSLSVTNNIIAFNSVGLCTYSGNPTLKKNCVYGNTTNYQNINPGATDISKDPLLENWRYGKLHIQPDSPCIDSGDNSAVNASWLDMDGQSRIQGAGVDIGADESNGTLWTANQPRIIRVSPSGNDANDGSSWELAKKTVQSGIDTVYGNGGGEVWVAAGVYNENITLKADCGIYGGFIGTENSRSERDFRVHKSTIVGLAKAGSASNAVTANGIETTACIDGFTIKNNGYGSGIDCESSSSLTISNNIITDAQDGICCDSNSMITNNTISGNNGGGISCGYNGNPTVTNNIIIGNGYTGIWAQSSNAIRNNVISGHYFGICCPLSSNSVIVNNTITSNSIGICCEEESESSISNNIIAYNTTGINNNTGTLTLKKNCLYGNETDYTGLSAGNTDLSEDPLLENWRFGKLHIQPESPCVDAGDGSVVDASWGDIDGQLRIQGSGVDIGADESDGSLWPVNQRRIVRVSPLGNDSNDGSSWFSAKKTVQAGIDAAYEDEGGDVWVAAGVYAENISLKLGCDIYGGFDGTENSKLERDFGTNKSIIDGSSNGNIITVSGVASACRIDGFTIRNSGFTFHFDTYDSCGIYIERSIVAVANNTITGCEYGICSRSRGQKIENNVISENCYGVITFGSTIFSNTVSSTIVNNTIVDNLYGIDCVSKDYLVNNIISFNVSGVIGCQDTTLKKNCVYGNSIDYSGISAGATDISQDPLLENWKYGRVHLRANSPCIGSGDGLAVYDSWLDMDGQERIQGNGVDIGADESDGRDWAFTPRIFRIRPSGDDNNDGSSWTLAKKTVQAGIDAANACGGGEIWVAAGEYRESIDLKTGCNLYGGFAGNENERSERDIRINKCNLYGSNYYIVAISCLGATSCIDGFNIVPGLGNTVAISCGWMSSPIIANNSISGNRLRGISCDNSSNPSIVNNVICGCEEGIRSTSSNATITNNTIICNTGTGIYSGASSTYITNNIIAYNTTGIEGYAQLNRNCVYGNGVNYSMTSPGSTDISADPLLENWNFGKAHIQPGSPCIDAGDSSVVDNSWVDMDSQSRMQGKSVDIGADESDGTVWEIDPLTVIYVSPAGDDKNDGKSWVHAKKTIQAGIDAAYNSGNGEVWVAAGIYTENIDLKFDCDMYGGFTGTENNRSQRNFAINKSIIDGSANGNVVTATGTATTARIDGFALRNSGCGIFCNSFASPEITNNIVTGKIYGIYCSSASPTIICNVICSTSNIGIYCTTSSNAQVINNTVAGNSGYGIVCYSSNPNITNNVIAFNTKTGIYNSVGTPTLNKNCVYGNNANYTGITAGVTDIIKDPAFINRQNGDYRLRSNSPCVDAGDDAVVGADWSDIDCEARITGSHIDIGADECLVLSTTIEKAKILPNSAYVLLNDMIVSYSYSSALNGRFYYIQDANRSMGMRVNQMYGSPPQANTVITLKGILSTTADGERLLLSYEPASVLGNKTAKSMMSVCKFIGGGDYFYNSASKTGQKGVVKGFGLNNIGLLMTVCGKVTSIDTVAKRVYINDGSADVAIYYGSIALPQSVAVGKLVKASGPCSCYKLENGDLGRLILLKDGNSIVTLCDSE